MPLHLLRCGHRLLSLRPPTSIAALRSYSLPAPNPDPATTAVGEPEMIDPRKLPSDYDPATFDPASHRPPPTDRVWRLVDEVCNLTLVEVAELSSLINPNPDPPFIGILGNGGGGGAGFGVAAGKGGAEGAAKEEKKVEKTVFELRLESFETANKLKVIKEVRAYSELGLKEAKELVEKAPAVFKAGVSKEEAEKIIEKMKEVGAKVVME